MDKYVTIIIGLINITFRKQLAQIAAGRNEENREIMAIVAVVAGVLLIVFGSWEVFNIIKVK